MKKVDPPLKDVWYISFKFPVCTVLSPGFHSVVAPTRWFLARNVRNNDFKISNLKVALLWAFSGSSVIIIIIIRFITSHNWDRIQIKRFFLAKMFLNDARRPVVDSYHSWTVVRPNLRKNNLYKNKQLCSTNLAASRHIISKMAWLSVNVRQSKTALLKLPNLKLNTLMMRQQ